MSARGGTDDALQRLADKAGLLCVWRDVHGRTRQVGPESLRSLLEALGLPCATATQISDSEERLEQDIGSPNCRMIVARAGEPIPVPAPSGSAYKVTFEDGARCDGRTTRKAAPSLADNASSLRRGPEKGSPPMSQGSLAEAIDIPGYHHLELGDTQLVVAVAPHRAPSVREVAGTSKAWGVAVQVYGLRRQADTAGGGALQQRGALYGAGDYGALAVLADRAGRQGADALAISPVHALFSADPQRYSPYAPSSRLFLNTTYIDPSTVLGDAALQRAMASLPSSARNEAADEPMIDWLRVADARMSLFRVLYEQFCQHPAEPLRQRFAIFRRQGGEALESHGRYEALHADFSAQLGPAHGWRDWPTELREPFGRGVQTWAAGHAHDVAFHIFLQWLATEGMKQAQASAREGGMAIGLISDLAIGTDPRGSHAWSRQNDILARVSVGAAPDLYQPRGQDWGLTAFSPRSMRDNAYGAFIETLRAALAHAGGVRIDHILGMARMWLVPDGADAKDGVYLRYPLQDLLHLISLEAWRRNAIAIGENLGTVPAGFDDRLNAQGILGTSVLWFERSGAAKDPGIAGGFTPSREWTPNNVATTTTHDLPTISGWWAGREAQWLKELGLATADEFARLMRARVDDKRALWKALRAAGLAGTTQSPPEPPPREAILRFVARAPAPLVLAPLEDLLGSTEQPNLPGTSSSNPPFHPNWRRRYAVPVEEVFSTETVQRGIAAVVQGRGESA
jgi:4-alpha-glucanotransferase